MNNLQSAEHAFEKQKKQRLFVGILFDLLGMATYAFPALGEAFDLAWAPIAASTFFAMYRGATGIIGGSVVFIEELIPFTDVLPTFTITWLWVYKVNGAKTKAKFLQRQQAKGDGTIDITHLQEDKKLPA
jgi:hypothetical protein